VVRVVDDDFALPSDRPVPEWCVGDLSPSRDEVGIAFSALAVAAGGTHIVIDPWLANDGPREGPDAGERADQLLGRLAEAGFPPDEVDIVVNTHLDGIGWNTRPDGDDGWRLSFPNARYLYPGDEVVAIDAGRPITGHEGFARLTQLVDVESVAPPTTLAPGVELVDAPGHNFGHLAVRVESDDALALYPGHLILTPFDIADPDADRSEPPNGHLAPSSRRRMLGELADRGGTLLTTLLGGSGSGRVARAGSGFSLS